MEPHFQWIMFVMVVFLFGYKTGEIIVALLFLMAKAKYRKP